jgi:hypothetical protein
LKSGRPYPSEFFSIKWEGYLVAEFTETYVISVEAYKTAQFAVFLDGVEVISNLFDVTNLDSLPQSAFFNSIEVDLESGHMYNLEVRYAEKTGPSKIRLFWESES